jgi:hypothetical protein
MGVGMENDSFSTIPTDDELRMRIRNFEDSFVERKTLGDSKDWLKTAVAFANSAPVGFPAILYLGVRDDGTPEPQAFDSNLEDLQQSFSKKLKPAYPRIAELEPRTSPINSLLTPKVYASDLSKNRSRWATFGD